ncbi:MAG: serine protease [Vicinamibacterales bacterium]
MRIAQGLLVAALLMMDPTALWSQVPNLAVQTSSFNQRWLGIVVSIEEAVPPAGFRPRGTGFLVRTANSHVVLVTAKHVALAPLPAGARLAYRLTTTAGGTVVVWDDELRERLGPWFPSPTGDVACRFIGWPQGESVALTPDNYLADNALTAGAPVLVLGFPLGLRSEDQPRPIARHGIIARVDRDNVIADAFVFPGNSGGPVIYSPSLKVGRGLTSSLLNEEKLIGIVSSFVPYRETAISQQTNRARIVFEENSGLSNVVPVAKLVDLLNSEPVRALDGSIR